MTNIKPGIPDKVGGRAHEPEEGLGYEGINRQLWPMDGLGEARGFKKPGICVLAQFEASVSTSLGILLHQASE